MVINKHLAPKFNLGIQSNSVLLKNNGKLNFPTAFPNRSFGTRYLSFSGVIFLLSIFLCLFPSTSWAEVKAFLNQDTFYIDDSVTLTIETNINTNAQPDLSPLKKDFNVINTSNRSQMSIINGKTSSKKSWIIQLQPLHQGKIIIPAISLGNEKTQALTLTISDTPPEVTASTKEHVFVEASVDLKDGKSPYIQQQISYTVKMFYDDQLLEYEMYPPNIDDAVIEQLQQKEKYRVSRNGKTYTVIERNYVISAEKSGELTIPPTIMKGSIRDKKSTNQKQQRQQNPFFANDPFFNDPFGSGIFSGSTFGKRGKAITLRSDPIKVNVQSLPSAFKGKNWLPAENVILTDSWQQQLPSFRVGEPVSRTLSIEAKGLASSQIPQLVLPQIEAIRAYPDQETNENYTDGATVIGKRTQVISYIPNQAGQLQLPEISFEWWNIVTKQQQTARLPAITINIESGSGSTITKTNVDKIESAQPSPSNAQQNASLPMGKVIPADNSSNYSWLLLIVTIISLTGIILVIMKNKDHLKKVIANKYTKKPIMINKKKQLLKHLQQACEQNNPQQAAYYLLQWVQQQWDRGDDVPQNLGTLAKQLALGSDLVNQLNHQLYAANNTHWDGTKLWNLVNSGLQRKAIQKIQSTDGLESLYPSR